MTTGQAVLAFLSRPQTYSRLGVIFTLAGWQIEPLLWDKIALYFMGGGIVISWVMDEIKRIKDARPDHHEP